ncbi:MAG: aldehyde dehydrogenase [Phycisphaerae bacterium]|nr:aldehyde dehydrogenase [Phycisphaerae bacterium]
MPVSAPVGPASAASQASANLAAARTVDVAPIALATVAGRECPSLAARRAFLAHLHRAVRARLDDLVAAVSREIGKPEFETVTGDIMPLLASIRWHRRHLPKLLGERRLGGKAWWQLGQRHRVQRVPVGDVAIIATWNYPIQLLGIQVVQAIAAGNRVTVKPSERTPLTQAILLELVATACRDAGLPGDTLRTTPATRDAGARLLAERRFDHIVFTGSTAVGRAIADIAARTLTPTTLELSGHDSAFVLDDADAALAARAIWHAATMNAGQTCMAPRRALVLPKAYGAFVAELARLAAAARPLPLVDEAAAQRCAALADDAIARGARSLLATAEPPRGRHLRPLALVDCPTDAPLFDGDHFGPLLAVTPVADFETALALHASVGHALATSVFTRSVGAIRRDAARFGSSFVTINDCVLPTAHPAASIAGGGSSGWGASRGAAGLLALTREVTVSTTGRLRTPLEPPSDSVKTWMRRLASFPFSSLPPSQRPSASNHR